LAKPAAEPDDEASFTDITLDVRPEDAASRFGTTGFSTLR
jgi:hypothetical protein